MKKERRHRFHHHLFMQVTPVLTSILAWTTMLNQHRKACQDFVGHLVIGWVLFLKSVYQSSRLQFTKSSRLQGLGQKFTVGHATSSARKQKERIDSLLISLFQLVICSKNSFFLLLFSYLLVPVALILYSLLPLFLLLWLWYFTTMMTE